MASPTDRRFSESHEWFRADGEIVTVGITKYAADELTDVTYVEIKPIGTHVSAGDPLGEVESVKTTSDVYSAVNGEIIEVNKAVAADPSLVNSDPFGKGWLAKLRVRDVSPLSALADSKSYDARYPVG